MSCLVISGDKDTAHQIAQKIVLVRKTDKVTVADSYDGKAEVVLLHEPENLDIIKEISQTATVFLLTDRNERDYILEAYDLGMADFCSPGVKDYELTIKVINAMRLHDALNNRKRRVEIPEQTAFEYDAPTPVGTGLRPKLFDKMFENKIETVIEPVFYRMQKEYFKTAPAITGDKCTFAAKTGKLEIVNTGTTKTTIRVSYDGLDSPENFEDEIALASLTQTRLERYIKDFMSSVI